MPGGCYYIDLQGCGSRAELLSRFSTALGLPAGYMAGPFASAGPPTSNTSPAPLDIGGLGVVDGEEGHLAAVVAQLACRGRCLIVVDNADSVAPPMAGTGGGGGGGLGASLGSGKYRVRTGVERSGGSAGNGSGGWRGVGGGGGVDEDTARVRDKLLEVVEGAVEALLRALEPSGSR